MDEETQKIVGEQKHLSELVSHQGWKIARLKLLQKIRDLKDAFQLDDSSPENMLIDLQSRKAAALLLTEFLREIEAAPEVVIENKPTGLKSAIINLED